MGEKVDVCVPTGNFGNILAAYYARCMGVPIRRLVCASNANNVLTDFLTTGTYDRNRPFYQTTSPSMDILISSNLERLLYLLSGSDEAVRGYMAQLAETGRYTVSEEIKNAIQSVFAYGFCDDAGTEAMIGEEYKRSGYLLDTHTAVAYRVAEQFRRADGSGTPMIVASTASPFKFCAMCWMRWGAGSTGTGRLLSASSPRRPGGPRPRRWPVWLGSRCASARLWTRARCAPS